MKTSSFSWKTRGESFRHAFEGLRNFFAWEHNTWFHAVATVACVVLAFVVSSPKVRPISLELT